jgi:acetyltransferase-like isoleucine patch superfamily enzyme
MLAGELYDPMDADLVASRARARDLCQAINATREGAHDERRRLVRELFATGGDTVWLQPPFFCDYGSNIELGQRVFFNFNCVVPDVCGVRIGDFTLFGPAVQIAGGDRLGRLGGWRRDHPAGGADRSACRHRRRQRGHPRCSRGRLRRGQSVPCDSRHHRVSAVG